MLLRCYTHILLTINNVMHVYTIHKFNHFLKRFTNMLINKNNYENV